MATPFKTLDVAATRRTQIDVAEALGASQVAGRKAGTLLSRDELGELLAESALVLDGVRRRTRYFDGRMLTGADLTRDQDYIRQRQNDLAQASGTGVVYGLRVALSDDPRGQTIVIEAGHGVTPSGAIVMIEKTRDVALMDLPETRRLDASLGLSRKPNQPLGRRTGLFIVALRPVEFSANPVSAYPTEITGQRRVEDGDIVEATALTLIAFPDGDSAGSLDEARRIVAQAIFSGTGSGMPQDALPLAMVALDRGVVDWIDTAMVRREVGADTPLQVSLGASPRALAEAFVTQHEEHLADVIAQRSSRGQGMAFPASEHFSLLPAVGPMPAAAISMGEDGLEQIYFPTGTDVTVGFIPADEMPAIVEETVGMPPIALDAKAGNAEGLSVAALIPVPRPLFQQFAQSLVTLDLKAKASVAATGSARPLATLNAMLLRRSTRFRPAPLSASSENTAILTAEESASLSLWQAALAEARAMLPRTADGTPLIYYARTRTIVHSERKSGTVVVSPDVTTNTPVSEESLESRIAERMGELRLKTRYENLKKQATAPATARINQLLGMRTVIQSDLFSVAAIKELEEALPQAVIERAAATPVVSATPTLTGLRTASVSPAVLTNARLSANTLAINRAATLRRATVLTRATESEAAPTMLSEADVAAVATVFKRQELGEGIRRLAKASDEKFFTGTEGNWLAETGFALEVDLVGTTFEGGKLEEAAKMVVGAIEKREVAQIEKIVRKLLGA